MAEAQGDYRDRPSGIVSEVAAGLTRLADEHPDAVVVRNQVGNLVFLRPEDGSEWGWINVLTGEWEYF